MTLAKTVLAAGTRFVGQLTAEGDVQIDGRFEGGPLQVSGRLTVGAGGHVEAVQAEVAEAEVLGLFRGTLKAREIVRLHSTGRVLGDIFSPRVVFVSDTDAAVPSAPRGAPPAAEPPIAARARRPVEPPTVPTRAEAAAPAPAPEAPSVPAPSASPSPVTVAAPAAPPAASPAVANRAPRRTPPTTSASPAAPPPAPAPPAVLPAPAAPAAPPAARTIPALPSLGQRTMQRLTPREP